MDLGLTENYVSELSMQSENAAKHFWCILRADFAEDKLSLEYLLAIHSTSLLCGLIYKVYSIFTLAHSFSVFDVSNLCL